MSDICKWKTINEGCMGFNDYYFKTECKNSICKEDLEQHVLSSFTYCPFCGKEIERVSTIRQEKLPVDNSEQELNR